VLPATILSRHAKRARLFKIDNRKQPTSQKVCKTPRC